MIDIVKRNSGKIPFTVATPEVIVDFLVQVTVHVFVGRRG